MFSERFASFVCPGDVISCEHAGFNVSARIMADDCPDRPDQRQDGFWPSLEKNAPGFIGPGPDPRKRVAEAQGRAEAMMDGWRRGEWFYCGVVLSVSLAGVELAPHSASLWGIEAHDPYTDNTHPTETAQALLPEALEEARAVLSRLASLARRETP
ncbi:hypothetical protein [Hyphomonas sp.]|uniref:hypothetical protein n=1 Tax=Hyphomonas sp. TaxID=87 RepID=UPI00391C4D9A